MSSSTNQKVIDGVVVLSEFNVDELSNPPTDKLYLYAEDNGSGITIIKIKDSLGDEKEIVKVGDSPLFSAVNFDLTAEPISQEGQVRWNDTDKCLEVVQDRGVILQVGQELTVRARNTSNENLPNGTAVYVNGATGQRPTVVKALANNLTTSETLIGLVTDDSGIDHNSDGHVTIFGLVRGLNTSSYEEGEVLYLSTDSAGTFTNVKPSAPSSYVVRIGYVTRSHVTQGTVLVSLQYQGSVGGSNMIESVMSDTPSSPTASGSYGQIAFNENYLYICTASNTWRRANLASW